MIFRINIIVNACLFWNWVTVRHYRDLWHILKEIKLIDITDNGNPLTEEEFVPGSCDFLDIKVRNDWDEPFGDILM